MSSDRPPLLYLVHRIPYPPNKGDKVRSFNILRQLARRHRIFLGTFVDHPDDVRYIEQLSEWCEETHVVRLAPRRARLRCRHRFGDGWCLLGNRGAEALDRWCKAGCR